MVYLSSKNLTSTLLEHSHVLSQPIKVGICHSNVAVTSVLDQK